MDYVPPLNGNTEDPDRPYVDADPANNVEGSIPSGAAIEKPQREILEAIGHAGLVPSGADLTQLRQAIVLIATAQAAQAVAALVDTAPGALDTLNELAAALGDDANFAATMTTALAGKLNNSGGTVTGLIDVFTAAAGIRLTSSDNTAALVTALALRRGSGAGNSLSVQTRGDAADGLDQLRLAFAGGQAYTFNKAGNFLLGGDPVAALDAATKQYVDARAGVGWGQQWTDVTGARAIGVTYSNDTPQPIEVKVHLVTNTACLFEANHGSGWVKIAGASTGAVSNSTTLGGVIPPAVQYRMATGGAIQNWSELRS